MAAAMDLTAEQAAAELKKGFETIIVEQKDPSVPVFHLYLNRPSHRNALSNSTFAEIPRALSLLDLLPSCRALIISGLGPHFCSGIDLSLLRSASAAASAGTDIAAASDALRRRIRCLQDSLTAIERFRGPVVAAIGGACVGAGLELAAACDVRCCDAATTRFSLREVDMGLTADLGGLQRIPAIVGYGNAADLALTGRTVDGAEAKSMGLVTRLFTSRAELDAGAAALAKELAEKPAVAVMGTKAVLLRTRELTAAQGLDFVATWNSAALMSGDLQEAIAAHLQRRKPRFAPKL